ncbi:MAG: hypothetical protein ACJAUH_003055 [Saprospiraceae bacterium]|jgi:hypothetical protein
MKLIKLIFIVFISFLSSNLIAQEVHEIRYLRDGVSYKCLLVKQEGGDIYMRVRYTDKEKKVRLVEVPYSTLSGSSNKKKREILRGGTPKYISSRGNNNYKSIHLVFIAAAVKPWIYFELNDAKSKVLAERYRKLAIGKVSEAYLKQFYFSKESEFSTLKKVLEVGEAASPNRFITLHLIVVANTKISDIGAGCRVDERNIVKEFETVSKVLGINLKTYIIDGDNFNKQKTLATLEKIKPRSNDVMMFIYRGHGFRWSDQSESWPQMDLRNGNYGRISKNTSIGLTEVFNTIRKKDARLNIVLADCCNNDIGINRKTKTPINALESKGSYDIKKLKKLFLESKGSLISCAASPGEYSWVNTSKGGFYTLSFIQALRKEVSLKNNNETNWKDVLDETVEGAKKKTERCKECTAQTGKFYSNVK